MNVKDADGGGHEDVVVRKAEHGWVVGDENVADLTSAMVLADLFAADEAGGHDTAAMEAVDENAAPEPAAGAARVGPPAPRVNPTGPHKIPAMNGGGVGDMADKTGEVGDITNKTVEAGEAERLAVTVAQLEHALASRVRVEQAIGVLAERHRIRPREAFDLLRRASRSRGTRVTDMAQDVVESTANPLLRLPDELSRVAPEPRQRGRSLRRAGRHAAS